MIIGNYIGVGKNSGGAVALPVDYWVTRYPTNLRSARKSDTELDLFWDNNGAADFDGCKVYYSTDGSAFSVKSTISIVETTTITGLTAGQKYWFYVKLYKGASDSVATNTVADYSDVWFLSGGISLSDCEEAYTAIGKTSLALSYVNEASPGTLNLSTGNAPILDQGSGWLFDGSTNYLLTGIVLGANHSAIIKFSDGNDNAADHCLFGVYTNATKMFVIENRVNTTPGKVQYGNGGALAVTPNVIKGTLAVAGNTGYRNGVADAGSIGVGTMPATAAYLGAMNTGSAYAFFRGIISHAAVYKRVLNPTEIAALHARLNIYTGLAERYVNKKIQGFFCWNMSTFGANEIADADGNPDTFAPTGLDIDQWLDALVAAKISNAMLTVKHHDGFMLWPSAQHAAGHDPYTIARTTWYANNGSPDIVKLFVDGCRSRGISVGLYFSILDNTHEARTGTDETSDAAGYVAMIEAQLTELLTNYGTIDHLWFDGWSWHITYAKIAWNTIRNFVKGLQPNCLVIDNRGSTSFTNSAVYVCENPIIGNFIPAANIVAAEDCDTIRVDSKWFHHPGLGVAESDYNDAATTKAQVDQAVARNGCLNLGLNPTAAGVLPQGLVNVLEDLGALL